MTLHDMEYPFGQFGAAVVAMSPPSLLSVLSLLSGAGGMQSEEEALMLLCKHCSATAKTLVCYQHCFSCKSQTLMLYAVMCFSLTVSPQIWEPVEIKYL